MVQLVYMVNILLMHRVPQLKLKRLYLNICDISRRRHFISDRSNRRSNTYVYTVYAYLRLELSLAIWHSIFVCCFLLVGEDLNVIPHD